MKIIVIRGRIKMPFGRYAHYHLLNMFTKRSMRWRTALILLSEEEKV